MAPRGGQKHSDSPGMHFWGAEHSRIAAPAQRVRGSLLNAARSLQEPCKVPRWSPHPTKRCKGKEIMDGRD